MVSMEWWLFSKMVYLLKMVVFHGYVINNQIIIGFDPRVDLVETWRHVFKATESPGRIPAQTQIGMGMQGVVTGII
jgi:hypothetical protein